MLRLRFGFSFLAASVGRVISRRNTMPVISRDDKGRVSFGRWELLIQVLIVLSLIEFAVETLPILPPDWRHVLRVFEIITVSLFTIEYLLRLLLGRPRLSYAMSFYGIVDLLAILPFYLSTGIDLRSVRAFRLLRLFRLFKLVRYSRAMQRFHRAFIIANWCSFLRNSHPVCVETISSVWLIS